MIAIDSYHEAFETSYVPVIFTTSPAFTWTRQSLGVAVIATSQETGPAGSQYFACERKSRTVRSPRVTVRSL